MERGHAVGVVQEQIDALVDSISQRDALLTFYHLSTLNEQHMALPSSTTKQSALEAALRPSRDPAENDPNIANRLENARCLIIQCLLLKGADPWTSECGRAPVDVAEACGDEVALGLLHQWEIGSYLWSDAESVLESKPRDLVRWLVENEYDRGFQDGNMDVEECGDIKMESDSVPDELFLGVSPPAPYSAPNPTWRPISTQIPNPNKSTVNSFSLVPSALTSLSPRAPHLSQITSLPSTSLLPTSNNSEVTNCSQHNSDSPGSLPPQGPPTSTREEFSSGAANAAKQYRSPPLPIAEAQRRSPISLSLPGAPLLSDANPPPKRLFEPFSPSSSPSPPKRLRTTTSDTPLPSSTALPLRNPSSVPYYDFGPLISILKEQPQYRTDASKLGQRLQRSPPRFYTSFKAYSLAAQAAGIINIMKTPGKLDVVELLVSSRTSTPSETPELSHHSLPSPSIPISTPVNDYSNEPNKSNAQLWVTGINTLNQSDARLTKDLCPVLGARNILGFRAENILGISFDRSRIPGKATALVRIDSQYDGLVKRSIDEIERSEERVRRDFNRGEIEVALNWSYYANRPVESLRRNQQPSRARYEMRPQRLRSRSRSPPRRPRSRSGSPPPRTTSRSYHHERSRSPRSRSTSHTESRLPPRGRSPSPRPLPSLSSSTIAPPITSSNSQLWITRIRTLGQPDDSIKDRLSHLLVGRRDRLGFAERDIRGIRLDHLTSDEATAYVQVDPEFNKSIRLKLEWLEGKGFRLGMNGKDFEVFLNKDYVAPAANNVQALFIESSRTPTTSRTIKREVPSSEERDIMPPAELRRLGLLRQLSDTSSLSASFLSSSIWAPLPSLPTHSFARIIPLLTTFGYIPPSLAARALDDPDLCADDAPRRNHLDAFLESQKGTSTEHYDGLLERAENLSAQNLEFMKIAKKLAGAEGEVVRKLSGEHDDLMDLVETMDVAKQSPGPMSKWKNVDDA